MLNIWGRKFHATANHGEIAAEKKTVFNKAAF
jgi:hypothetical protein